MHGAGKLAKPADGVNTPYLRQGIPAYCQPMQNEKSLGPGNRAIASFQCPTYPPLRILMVDDDPYLCEINAEVLRRHSYEINTVRDGEAGWDELQTNHYHLLITENDLPRLTGVGLVKKLRAACMPLPVIMVTGPLPTWESPHYSWLLKATKLLKPYGFDELLGLVKKVLAETASARAAMAPSPRWQSQPLPNRFRPR
jgi:DNA-binding response OmpR family regulator